MFSSGIWVNSFNIVSKMDIVLSYVLHYFNSSPVYSYIAHTINHALYDVESVSRSRVAYIVY